MTRITRPPIVAIMGHVDHGKSSLLDAIRRSNIVAGEAGGITQHLSAYEVVHKDESGAEHSITFIDTPGHAAFTHMRTRGAAAADIAILIVSSEEGVKAQTIEAIQTIRTHNVPTIVAISKIDRPEANPDRIKQELMEHELFVEGYGGTTSCVAVSAVTGAGIPELLETISLLAEVEEFTGDPDLPGEGFIIEANMDGKRGIAATMIIKDGSIKSGQFVVADDAWTTTRILEDFQGKTTTKKTCSAPVRIVGFDRLPMAGTLFTTLNSKTEAEALATLNRREKEAANASVHESAFVIPLILKTDVAGTGDAIAGQIALINDEAAGFKIIRQGVGPISETDMQLALANVNTIIVGFTVPLDRRARDMAGADRITVKTFDIIYHLTEWLAEEREKRRPRKTVEKVLGTAKVIKIFSTGKNSVVLGGRVESGTIDAHSVLRVLRRDTDMGRAKIENLQKGKTAATSAMAEEEFGMMLKTPVDIVAGDVLEAIKDEIV
jgi:translation initiation factor IF-2